METQKIAFTIDQAEILAESVATYESNGRKLKAFMSEFIRIGLTKWTNPNTTKEAEALLVYFWQAVEREAGSDASIRTLFNRESKELLGFPVKVADSKLVKVQERKRSGDTLKEVLKAIDKSADGEARDALAAALAKFMESVGTTDNAQ